MRKTSDYVSAMDEQISLAARSSAAFLCEESERLDGRVIRVEESELVHFGSCSYLGLELDERLKEGVIDATLRYGTQFSSSRAYLSVPLYQQLEELLEAIFGAPTLVCPSTSMGHASALPVLIEEDDAVILDQQVHASVQMAVNHVRMLGVPVTIVRHNRLDLLEERIVQLSRQHRRIWYLADGVYSMFGDFAPLEGLAGLLSRYEQLHYYIDDAHAMSWCGDRGRGHALGAFQRHPRVVVATSLNKAFAAAGGALILHDQELKRKIRTVGMPLVFSGPVQPPMLGAAVASARIHLLPEFSAMQAELAERIKLCNQLCRDLELPLVGHDDTPVRFIGTIQPRASFLLMNRLREEGYFSNSSFFPIVPMKRAGLRFTITRHLKKQDIQGFLEAVAHHLPVVLAEFGMSLQDVFQTFKIEEPATAISAATELSATIPAQPPLSLQHATSVEALDAEEWDRLLGDRGTFTHSGLRLLEQLFCDHQGPGGSWKFHYFLVRDHGGKVVLATFFTEALWKDDMMASSEVSRRVEALRKTDPTHLTTTVFAMGSLLTEGNHLYMDRTGDWRSALDLLLGAVGKLAQASEAPMIALRDLPAEDTEIAGFLAERDFVRFPMLEGHVVSDLSWSTEEEYHAGLSFKSRRHRMSQVVPWNDFYGLTILDGSQPGMDPSLRSHLYRLYREVQAQSFDLNTFPIPETFLDAMMDSPDWEFLVLHISETDEESEPMPVAFAACFKGETHYVPHLCGLDYRFVRSHGTYRQLLRHCLLRARALEKSRLELGLGATLEKRRVGAASREQNVFVQNTDPYQAEVLAELMGEAKRASTSKA